MTSAAHSLPMPSPTLNLPACACDCHTHVFLDPDAFALAPGRRYTPPAASIETLVDWHDQLGIGRVVVVQPSVYGDDNSSLLHALRKLGPARARGVATLGAALTDTALDELGSAGVRGIRVNLEIDEERDIPRATADLQRVADRIASRGWHVQVYASLALLADCAQMLRALPVPVVLDHFAGWRSESLCPDDEARAWASVLDLVGAGQAWVKLSAAYRASPRGAADPAVEGVARRLIAANPARMLWGSDWPHPNPAPQAASNGVHAPFAVDRVDTLAHLRRWCDEDEALLRRILVENPAALYGFTA
jgi:predicted TIM-barrel fold metal-dependent hydrolase